jgi:hypothetical protein
MSTDWKVKAKELSMLTDIRSLVQFIKDCNFEIAFSIKATNELIITHLRNIAQRKLDNLLRQENGACD